MINNFQNEYKEKKKTLGVKVAIIQKFNCFITLSNSMTCTRLIYRMIMITKWCLYEALSIMLGK